MKKLATLFSRRDAIFKVLLLILVSVLIFDIRFPPKNTNKPIYVLVDDDEPPVFDSDVEGEDNPLEPCVLKKWNDIGTERIENGEQHRKWVAGRLGDIPNLLDGELRPVSAFLYDKEIVVTTTTQNRYGKTVHCRYFDCNRRELDNSTFETIMFPLSAAYCIRRVGVEYITITDGPNDEIRFDPIPLTLRIDDGYKYEVSVCVGPIYGKESRWLEIAETTEHHLLMGIQHFYYTIFNKMDEYTRKLVDEYERLGYFEVTVIQNEYSTMDWMSHLLQIHDCHFRSRHHSKWVLNVDIDERLVMLKKPLHHFLRSIEPQYSEVIFASKRVIRTQLLPEKYLGENQLLGELQFLKYNWTLDQKTSFASPKVFFRPENQHPKVLIKSIPTSEAYVRHYRTGQKSLLDIWFHKKYFAPTRLAPKFEEKVRRAVARRLDTVYLQRPIRCEELRKELLGRFARYNYDCQFSNGKWYREVGHPGLAREKVG